MIVCDNILFCHAWLHLNYSFNYQANSETEPLKKHCGEHIEATELHNTKPKTGDRCSSCGIMNTIITGSFRHINLLK